MSNPRIAGRQDIGPLARTADDLALLYAIIAGPDGRDTDVPPVPVDAAPEIALKDLRIAVAPTFPGVPVAAEIRAAVERLATHLGSLGTTVEEAMPPGMDVGADLASAGALIGMMTGATEPGEGEQPATLARYLEALHRRDASIVAWERFFASWDVLLCPPSMTAAFPHCETGSPLRVDGQKVSHWAVNVHTTLFNYTGHPAIVLPYRLSGDGLPIGVQIVEKRWGDARLLGIARALADVTGAFRRPPGQ